MTQTATPSPPPVPPTAPRRRGRRRWLLLATLLAIAGAGLAWYLHGLATESTDDAFLAADVFQVNAKVAGRVLAVPVTDNQDVEPGQLLVGLETDDYDSRVAQAEAAVALARAQLQEATVSVTWTDANTKSAQTQTEAELTAAQARLQQEQAGRDVAQAEADRARADRQRYSQLSDRAVSRQRLDEITAAATTAESALLVATRRAASATADVAAAEAKVGIARADRDRIKVAEAVASRREAEVQAAEAALREARLQLAQTRIVAPAAGRVTRKSVLPGTYVQPGQTLLSLVGRDLWVVANFKETQLRELRPGQPATVWVDAVGAGFAAHVDSIQAGSGGFFSLLPPENATGNFVKVVQRVPVKLRFDVAPDRARFALGPGMSVVPVVNVR